MPQHSTSHLTMTFLIKYRARPNAMCRQQGKTTDADCTFWITGHDPEEAKKRALCYGLEMGWDFKHWQLVTLTDPSDCGGDPRQFEKFEKAQRDGVACSIEILEQDEQLPA